MKRGLPDDVFDGEVLQRRLAGWRAPVSPYERGWYGLHVRTGDQADQGADLDLLRGSSGHDVTRGSH